MYRFTVNLVPMATANMNMIITPRPKGAGPQRPMVVKTSEANKWLKQASGQLFVQRMAMNLRTIETPVALSMVVWRKRNSGDLDNYYKGICDALEAAEVVRNDKLITHHRDCRVATDPKNPRYELIIYPLDGDGSLFPLPNPGEVL